MAPMASPAVRYTLSAQKWHPSPKASSATPKVNNRIASRESSSISVSCHRCRHLHVFQVRNWHFDRRRLQQMLVFTFGTRHGFGHFVNRLLKYVRDFCFAAVRHEELRRDPAAKHLVLSPQLTIEDAEAVKEDQTGLDLGFLLSLFRHQLVARDQQVIAGFEAIHVQTDDR